MTDLRCGRDGDTIRLLIPEYVEHFRYQRQDHHPDWASEDFWLYEHVCDLGRKGWSFRDAVAEVAALSGVTNNHVRSVCNTARSRKNASRS